MVALGSSKFNLNPVNPIAAVNEQDQYEYERNLQPLSVSVWPSHLVWTHLHAILYLAHHRILRDEGEEFSLPCIWERDNQKSEETDLEDENGKDLRC